MNAVILTHQDEREMYCINLTDGGLRWPFVNPSTDQAISKKTIIKIDKRFFRYI